MKTFYTLFICSLIHISIYSQPRDPKAFIGGHSEGAITKAEIIASEKMVTNSDDIVIVGFTFSYSKGDDIIEFSSKSDKLTEEMKEAVKLLTPGTEIAFENIKAKQGDKTLILESVNLKLK